jgi:hypothetical protein
VVNSKHFEDRILKLEKENRRFRQLGISALVIVTLLLLMGQAAPKKVVEANEFILKDGAGHPRASLRIDEKTLQTEFALVDQEGNNQILLSADDSVGGAVVVRKAGNDTALLLTHGFVALKAQNKGTLVLEPSAVAFRDVKEAVKGLFASDELTVSDDRGFATQIGVTDLTKISIGEKLRTSAASIVLLGKNNEVLWKTP